MNVDGREVKKIDATMLDEWQDVPGTDLQVMIRAQDPLSLFWVRKKEKLRGRPSKEAVRRFAEKQTEDSFKLEKGTE